MPTYQYKCRDCGEDLEVVQSFSDESLTVCPACSGSLRKVFSAVGISFKGSGFYKTDSRATSKPASSPSSDSGTSAAPGSSSDTSKPDSKSSGSGDSSSSPKPESSKSTTSTSTSTSA